MRTFLGKSFAFTALALFFLIFSTSIASANMPHKQVKGTIINKTGCPMMKCKSGCSMMNQSCMKCTTGCPMMKEMTMNGGKHNMKMNKKM